MWPILFAPPLVAKALPAFVTLWLAGAAAAGALVGRRDAENARNRAELARLAAANQALAARLASLPAAASAPDSPFSRPRRSAASDGKAALLKHIVEVNLALRADLDKQANGEEKHG